MLIERHLGELCNFWDFFLYLLSRRTSAGYLNLFPGYRYSIVDGFQVSAASIALYISVGYFQAALRCHPWSSNRVNVPTIAYWYHYRSDEQLVRRCIRSVGTKLIVCLCLVNYSFRCCWRQVFRVLSCKGKVLLEMSVGPYRVRPLHDQSIWNLVWIMQRSERCAS